MMEISALVKATSFVPSPNGYYIAAFQGSILSIISASSTKLNILRTINCSMGIVKWSDSSRLLVYTEDAIKVWDLDDPSWTSHIQNGSGGHGKIVHVEFGRTINEILVFSDFLSKLTIWSLVTGRNVEIKDPKFLNHRGQTYRNKLGIFTQITRSCSQDVLSLHAPNSYKVIKSIVLPTIDAQGFKWSPNEEWLVVWDTSSLGQSLYVYTADLHLYQTYTASDVNGIASTGIKSVEWGLNGQYLAVAGTDRRVTLLSTKTFSPLIFLDHTSVIQLPENGTLWQEQAAANLKRVYQKIPQPYSLPVLSVSGQNASNKTGISCAVFNSDESIMATKDDLTPTTAWIWNLKNFTPSAVLVHHSPIKSMSWHPRKPDLLLISCIQEDALINLWNTKTLSPDVVQLPLEKLSTKQECRWLGDRSSKQTCIIMGDSKGFSVVRLLCDVGKPIAECEADDSTDSVYEALLGSPQKENNAELLVSEAIGDMADDVVDDTFVNRKPVGIFG